MIQINDVHLRELENEAIFVMREVAAQFEKKVILFSGGKDSIVLVHLAKKAFWPARMPFSLMNIDTGHNFEETLRFRDDLAKVNNCGWRCRIHGSPLWCMKRRLGFQKPLSLKEVFHLKYHTTVFCRMQVPFQDDFRPAFLVQRRAQVYLERLALSEFVETLLETCEWQDVAHERSSIHDAILQPGNCRLEGIAQRVASQDGQVLVEDLVGLPLHRSSHGRHSELEILAARL